MSFLFLKSKKMNSKKQIALVTEASIGIGEVISRELSKRGWLVIGIARSSDKLSRIKNDLQDAFISMICDISKKENIEETSQKILEQDLFPFLFLQNYHSNPSSSACQIYDETAQKFTMKLIFRFTLNRRSKRLSSRPQMACHT
jgi:hypothetical protein